MKLLMVALCLSCAVTAWGQEPRILIELAEQGDAEAHYNLGKMYAEGEGVPYQDESEAAWWFRRAAEEGHTEAQYNLGNMYAEGQGVQQDYAKAVSWYRSAAEQGHADAQYNLGVLYTYGQGVPRDDVLAHMWLDLAASRSTGAEQRKEFAAWRDVVAATMTPPQIAEAQRLAREWEPRPEAQAASDLVPLAATQPAEPSEIDAAKQVDIRRLIEVTRAAKTDEMFDALASQMKRLSEKFEPHDELKRVIQQRMIEKLRQEMSSFSRGRVDSLVPAYDRHFTHKEIKELLQFYESSTGQRVIEVMPELTVETVVVRQKFALEVLANIMREIAEEFALQLEPK